MYCENMLKLQNPCFKIPSMFKNSTTINNAGVQKLDKIKLLNAHLENIILTMMTNAGVLKLDKVIFKRDQNEWLATCSRKPKVPSSSPAANYVQR